MRVWDEKPNDREREMIRENLVAFSYLSDWEFPQREEWEREIHADDERMIQSRDTNLNEPRDLLEGKLPRGNRLDPATLDDDWDDLDDRQPHFDPTTLRQVNVVGCNDPCPCGSGKKYKKCCLHAAAMH